LDKELIMPKNMGTIDRIIRTVAALGISALYLTHQITGTAAIILGVVAVIFVLTSLISFCPLYFPFKFSTGKK
jgi:hypothetical protein